MKRIILLSFAALIAATATAQTGANYSDVLGQDDKVNAINTAVPFLRIAPDSRSGAMGDAGIAISPDAYAQIWNSSKLAFVESPYGLSFTYVPWLRELINDMNLAYVSGYYKIDDMQTIGASLRYFSMGNINFTDNGGNNIGSYSPHELAVDASYNRKLSKNFSLGLAGRFIFSNLTGGQGGQNQEQVESGKSFAVDINGFYKDEIKIADYNCEWSAGFNISNLGAKLGYTEDTKNFIPTNLGIGGALTMNLDQYNKITATIDFNKLLVPTPPLYYQDSTDINGERIIWKGKDDNVGIIQGAFQSFGDAPDGFREELKEITTSVGLEYWYANQFAARMGYFHENAKKGNRKYFTAGVGVKMKMLGLDISYLIPAGNFSNSPLKNTWRFSLTLDVNDLVN
ncbi:MAG: type IX secretion system outer membrane channel protein PorV [Salinivirgaceae bacterium]|nr:type IX secretion system outer membrane channel protein PorV [Salinivirgaceae bacterium]MBR5168513.1 type IX secretion system outer membrane channel protein PorV [Salinivirgaceae bacterium]